MTKEDHCGQPTSIYVIFQAIHLIKILVLPGKIVLECRDKAQLTGQGL